MENNTHHLIIFPFYLKNKDTLYWIKPILIIQKIKHTMIKDIKYVGVYSLP